LVRHLSLGAPSNTWRRLGTF